MFDVFGKEGAGALAAWMILTGNRDALDPVLQSLHGLVAQLSDGHAEERVAENTLALVLSALGDSFSGERSPRPSECRATRRATSPPSGFASGSQPKADIDRSEARTHNRTHDDAFARLDLDPSRRFGRAGELLLCQGGWDELTRD